MAFLAARRRLRYSTAVAGLTLLVLSMIAASFESGGYASAQYGNFTQNGIPSSRPAMNMMNSSSNNSMSMPGQLHMLKGQISNVQLDNNGQAAWVESGWWILKVDEGSNHTNVWFLAKVEMVKIDGTSYHVHAISNFSLSDISNLKNSTIFTGTATVLMPTGPVSDVPVTIKIINMSLLAIKIGPDKVNGHFGTAPIYGTIFHSGKGQSMMALSTNVTQNMHRANLPLAIPLEMGLYDKKDVFFITPEVSDKQLAEHLSNLTKFPVTYAPALAYTPANQALGNIYIFKNGIKGAGAMGFQPDVFDSIPGDSAYTPLWRVNFVEWKTSGPNATNPTVLGSDDATLNAASNGQVTITPTGIVRNCPIIQWGGNKDNTISPGHMMVRADRTTVDNMSYQGGQLLNIDTGAMQATFLAHRTFGPDGSAIYRIILDASVNDTASRMGIIYTNNTAAVAQSNASSDIFQFTNGIRGTGTNGWQPDIGSTSPGDMDYSPIEKVKQVSWTDPSKAVLLQSTQDLQTHGDQIKVVDAGVVIDSPAFNATTVMEHMNTALLPASSSFSTSS